MELAYSDLAADRPADAIARLDPMRDGWDARAAWLDACDAAGVGVLCALDPLPGDPPGWFTRRHDPDGAPESLQHPEDWRAALRRARRDGDDRSLASLAADARRAVPDHPEILVELYWGRAAGRHTERARRRVARDVRRARPIDDVARFRWLRLAAVTDEREVAERLAGDLAASGHPHPAARPSWSASMRRAMASALAATRDPEATGPTGPDRLAVAGLLAARLLDAGRTEEAEQMWATVRRQDDSSSAAASHALVLVALGRGDDALVASQRALDLAAGPTWDDVARLDRARWASELAEALEAHARALEATGRERGVAAALGARVLPSERTDSVVQDVGAEPGSLEGPAGFAVSLILDEDPSTWDAHAAWSARQGFVWLARAGEAHAAHLRGHPTAQSEAVRAAWGVSGVPVDRPLAAEPGDSFPLGDVGLEAGSPVVIAAWASWCGPCVREIPDLDLLIGELGVRGVALSVDAHESQYRKALARFDLLHLQARRDPDLGGRLGVSALPTLWIVDARGVLLERRVGYSEDALGAVRSLIGGGE